MEEEEMQLQKDSLGPSRINDPTLFLLYKMSYHLGKGSFASVNKAIHKKSGKQFAVKTYNNHMMGKHRSM